MGKTGTTSDFRDALFVGSTYGRTGITVAVRIGFDDLLCDRVRINVEETRRTPGCSPDPQDVATLVRGLTWSVGTGLWQPVAATALRCGQS